MYIHSILAVTFTLKKSKKFLIYLKKQKIYFYKEDSLFNNLYQYVIWKIRNYYYILDFFIFIETLSNLFLKVFIKYSNLNLIFLSDVTNIELNDLIGNVFCRKFSSL